MLRCALSHTLLILGTSCVLCIPYLGGLICCFRHLLGTRLAGFSRLQRWRGAAAALPSCASLRAAGGAGGFWWDCTGGRGTRRSVLWAFSGLVAASLTPASLAAPADDSAPPATAGVVNALSAAGGSSLASSPPVPGEKEADDGLVLPHKVDTYNGIVVAPLPPSLTPEELTSRLGHSLRIWRAAGRRGVWLRVAVEQAALVPHALAVGMVPHHAEPSYFMLNAWLPGGASSLPGNPTHQVGVGAFVVSREGRVLVVQEKTGPAAQTGFWKLPTGLAEPGEDVGAAAVREVLEETGVVTRFVSILGFRQAHAAAWGKSDMFFLCALELVDAAADGTTAQEAEIAAVAWMPLAEWSAMPHVADEATVWGFLNRLCIDYSAGARVAACVCPLP